LPLVYVHGAGRQAPAPTLKRQLDGILFGADVSTTRVAYYADVLWGTGAGAAAATRAGRSGRARRQRAIRSTLSREVSPAEAADAIVAATLGPTRPRARGAGAGRSSAGTETGSAVEAATSADTEAATRLVRQLYRRADHVAARSAVPTPGLAAGITFPDPIFRWVVGAFASDVIAYLYGPSAEAMRAPVRRVLLQDPQPRVIVAHSLGTIILYDVLSEPALAHLAVDLLVTVGCPLGIGNVQNRLRNGAGRPNPLPPELAAWSNYADRFDPVAIDQTLRDEFKPPFVVDAEVNNAARNNHDLTGYLSIALVRDRIVGVAGQ
jgi:hypothetical protein